MGDLRLAVGDDVVRERYLQATPILAIFTPWLDLLARKPRLGIKKRQGQIGPQSLAGKEGDVEPVPWILELLADEGRLWIVASSR